MSKAKCYKSVTSILPVKGKSLRDGIIPGGKITS